jgi:hypothetical protein
MRKAEFIEMTVEKFNFKEWEDAIDSTGSRCDENMGVIKRQLEFMLKHASNKTFDAGQDVFNKPEILNLLTNIEILIDELTLYYHKQIEEVKNEEKRKFEAERRIGNLL